MERYYGTFTVAGPAGLLAASVAATDIAICLTEPWTSEASHLAIPLPYSRDHEWLEVLPSSFAGGFPVWRLEVRRGVCGTLVTSHLLGTPVLAGTVRPADDEARI